MLSLFLLSAIVFSDVIYDVIGTDEGREWIEIKNSGAEPVDLTGWKLFEGGVHHKITPVGGAIIQPGGRAAIADSAEAFAADNPNYPGLVFDSSFSLKNTGETLVLKDASGNEAALITYVPEPKPVPPKQSKESGPNPTSTASPTTAVSPPIPPAPVAAAVAAEQDSRTFGMLPWIAGVLAIATAGIAAIVMSGKKSKSGFTITEEKS